MMKIPLHGEFVAAPFRGRRLLERALVVVRFTPVLKIAEESGIGIADFQEALRASYPLAEIEHEAMMKVELRSDGSIGSSQEKQPVWRLSDIDSAWRVMLTPRSIALEADGVSYKDWADFSSRVSVLIDEVARHFEPSHRQFIGVRYINAAPVDNGDDPRGQCATELVSITGNSDLELADLLWRFSVDEGHLLLRSGVMPEAGSYDPAVFMPRDSRTWYLDIDVTNNETASFEAEEIKNSILAQVKRAHAVYWWAMKRNRD